MKQKSLEASGFEKYRKKTRKGQFLGEMEQIIPWKELCEVIAPYYPNPQGAGRKPIGLERMLRIHFLQQWFELSDPAAEEALYNSHAMRLFVGVDLGNEPVPDETTICNFRHLMERNNLGDELFRLVNVYLAESDLKVNRGTIVDATIINAPSSTKNKEKKRDPEMHHARKGNQWCFGMKAHIGVDSQTKLMLSVAVTPANVHDSKVMEDLLRCNETRILGDSAYAGQKDKLNVYAPRAKDFTQKKGSRYRSLTEAEQSANRHKLKTRARVEHVFGVMKRQFGFTKVRYCCPEKNAHCVFTKYASVNLVVVKKHLLAI